MNQPALPRRPVADSGDPLRRFHEPLEDLCGHVPWHNRIAEARTDDLAHQFGHSGGAVVVCEVVALGLAK